MIKVKEDVTDKYYQMIAAFNADNVLKCNNKFFEKEKKLFEKKDKRLMKDIDLLQELEFDLRHEFVKIVKIDREKLWSEENE